jgi:protein O-mannosyl-transferase
MRYRYTIMVVLMVATLAVFWRGGSNDFVSFDDWDYVYQNVHVQSGLTPANIRWAFTESYAANWHPLTWLSHMADCQLYGLNPHGHHFTNILLHTANTALLFLLLSGLTGACWRSAFVAALFALHPLHVESVAWIAERKDVLSTFFFLLTLLAYGRYVSRPAVGRYLAVLAAFAAGLMAKPMLVTLPFVLLLLDYWPLGRCRLAPAPSRAAAGVPGHADRPGYTISRLVLEKLPFFALTAGSILATLYAQKKVVQHVYPLSFRVANALVAYASYLGKMVWPSKLAVLYPLPTQMLLWQIALSALLLGVITVAACWLARRAPYLPVGWAWFLGTLVPVIGLVQVGVQSMADRYSYIPLIGIFIAIVWGANDLAARWPQWRKVMPSLAVAAVLLCSVLTWLQLGYWRNTYELFNHALHSTEDNYTAEGSVGRALADRGEIEQGMAHYQQALRINPNYALARVDLAFALFTRGKADEAIEQYRRALATVPIDDNTAATGHNNLGIALGAKGQTAEAIEQFKMALALNHDYADAHYNLALALSKVGNLPEALQHYQESARLNPSDQDVVRNMQIVQERLRMGEGRR